jgi:RNA polymerase sigma-70 factor, ECF subfamily
MRDGDRREGVFTLSQTDFNRLVSDHAPALYRLAFRLVGDAHEAEDVVQDTFRSAWKGQARFDATRAGRPWLAAILRRRVADRWRRRPPPRLADVEAELDVGVVAPDPLFDEFTDEMQQALDHLPLTLRESLLLVVVAELTHQEAADILGVPLGTVLSRVSRARVQLREYWLAEQKRR